MKTFSEKKNSNLILIEQKIKLYNWQLYERQNKNKQIKGTITNEFIKFSAYYIKK